MSPLQHVTSVFGVLLLFKPCCNLEGLSLEMKTCLCMHHVNSEGQQGLLFYSLARMKACKVIMHPCLLVLYLIASDQKLALLFLNYQSELYKV